MHWPKGLVVRPGISASQSGAAPTGSTGTGAQASAVSAVAATGQRTFRPNIFGTYDKDQLREMRLNGLVNSYDAIKQSIRHTFSERLEELGTISADRDGYYRSMRVKWN